MKGIICFNMGLTLREGDREYFYRQLDRHFPGLKQEYIRRYGNSYEVPSPRDRELMKLFHKTCEQAGILHDVNQVFHYLHEFPDRAGEAQLRLF